MTVFLIAGESSGDLHGEQIVRKLKGWRVLGVGGARMRAAGLQAVLETEGFSVMGFVDVLWALPRLIKYFFFLRRKILQLQPEVVLTIDYPGFNLRLLRSLRKKGFKGKLYHYISPSVWAWGKKRIALMEEVLDALFVILPFERDCFASSRLRVEYVGHPLVSRFPQMQEEVKSRTVMVFPGSRKKEIERNLSLQLEALKEIEQIDVMVSVSAEEHRSLIEEIVRRSGVRVSYARGHEKTHLAACAVAKSGTVTLELALLGVPTVVTYAVGRLDWLLAKYLFRIKLPFVALPNLIAKEEVFKELIGPKFTKEALREEVQRLLGSQEERNKCERVRELLGTKEASEEVVRAIDADAHHPS